MKSQFSSRVQSSIDRQVIGGSWKRSGCHQDLQTGTCSSYLAEHHWRGHGKRQGHRSDRKARPRHTHTGVGGCWRPSSIPPLPWFKGISNKGKQVSIIDGYVIKVTIANSVSQGSILFAHKKGGEVPGSNVKSTIIGLMCWQRNCPRFAEEWPQIYVSFRISRQVWIILEFLRNNKWRGGNRVKAVRQTE